VTTLFAEYTGNHPAIDIDWSADRRVPLRLNALSYADSIPVASADTVAAMSIGSDVTPLADVAAASALTPSTDVATSDVTPAPSFSTFWDFARALNRSDPAAIRLAENGDGCDIPLDGRELRKLLGTFWFRSVFPRLSPEWQDRILNVLVEQVTIPNHALRNGRRTVHLHEMTHEQRQRMMTESGVPDAIRADLQLLVTAATLWGDDVMGRFEFTPVPESSDSSRIGQLLQSFRHS
jgi:hypothetical protein